MLEGWNDVIYADPEILLDRGYDKVILVTRERTDLKKSLLLYHRQVDSIEKLIKLLDSEPKFLQNIDQKYDQINKEIDDPRFLKITLEDWNNFTFQTFNELLDFLEFPETNRPFLIPVKSNRDFEGYSCSHLPKEHLMCNQIKVIRNGHK